MLSCWRGEAIITFDLPFALRHLCSGGASFPQVRRLAVHVTKIGTLISSPSSIDSCSAPVVEGNVSSSSESGEAGVVSGLGGVTFTLLIALLTYEACATALRLWWKIWRCFTCSSPKNSAFLAAARSWFVVR